jgi:GNAT superfamily N-acetyltransferase
VNAVNVELRQATPLDAAGIAEVYLASRKTFLPFASLAHSDAEVERWIADVLVPAGEVTVAMRDDQLVGMMVLSRDGPFGWIDQLYLHPSAVGLGIGSRLVEQAKQRWDDVAAIRLHAFQANVPARRFYERHGFEAVAFSDGHANEERCPDVLYEFRRCAR